MSNDRVFPRLPPTPTRFASPEITGVIIGDSTDLATRGLSLAIGTVGGGCGRLDGGHLVRRAAPSRPPVRVVSSAPAGEKAEATRIGETAHVTPQQGLASCRAIRWLPHCVRCQAQP